MRNPKVFLFDEPLSNLDAALRVNMRLEIEKLHRKLDATIIYVTHDQTEAMTLADRIVALDYGEVQQVGSPQELYDSPANKFVAGFIGSPKMNLFDADVSVDAGGKAKLTLAGADFGYTVSRSALNEGETVTIGIRPEALEVSNGQTALPADTLEISGKVESVDRHGNISYVYADVGLADVLTVQILPTLDVRPEDAIILRVPSSRLHIFDSSGLAIRE